LKTSVNAVLSMTVRPASSARYSITVAIGTPTASIASGSRELRRRPQSTCRVWSRAEHTGRSAQRSPTPS
jgi:hypothetical protein